MIEMPRDIWALAESDKKDHGSWSAQGGKKHPQQDTPTRYINTDMLLEELEGMKHSDQAAKNGYYCTGFNTAIDELIARIK